MDIEFEEAVLAHISKLGDAVLVEKAEADLRNAGASRKKLEEVYDTLGALFDNTPRPPGADRSWYPAAVVRKYRDLEAAAQRPLVIGKHEILKREHRSLLDKHDALLKAHERMTTIASGRELAVESANRAAEAAVKDLQDLRYGVESALKAAFDHVLRKSPPAGDYASQITALGDQVRGIREGHHLVGQMEDALDRTYRAISRTRTSSGSPDAYADQVRALGVMIQDLNHRLGLKGEDLGEVTAERDALRAKILKFQDALSELDDVVQA